jgi:hypothetical protein
MTDSTDSDHLIRSSQHLVVPKKRRHEGAEKRASSGIECHPQNEAKTGLFDLT